MLERAFNVILSIVLLAAAGLKSYYLSYGGDGREFQWPIWLTPLASGCRRSVYPQRGDRVCIDTKCDGNRCLKQERKT